VKFPTFAEDAAKSVVWVYKDIASYKKTKNYLFLVIHQIRTWEHRWWLIIYNKPLLSSSLILSLPLLACLDFVILYQKYPVKKTCLA
jgi:hypothetical protein